MLSRTFIVIKLVICVGRLFTNYFCYFTSYHRFVAWYQEVYTFHWHLASLTSTNGTVWDLYAQTWSLTMSLIGRFMDIYIEYCLSKYMINHIIGTCSWVRISPGIYSWLLNILERIWFLVDFWHTLKSAKSKNTVQGHQKPDFSGVLEAYGRYQTKWNKWINVHIHKLSWIFASNNGLIHVMYLTFMQEINSGEKKISNLKIVWLWMFSK